MSNEKMLDQSYTLKFQIDSTFSIYTFFFVYFNNCITVCYILGSLNKIKLTEQFN